MQKLHVSRWRCYASGSAARSRARLGGARVRDRLGWLAYLASIRSRIRLGILPELIEPGHPEQNGRHERMHRTLKRETLRPPAATARAQQRVFDRFQREFNEERPHEALGQSTPAARDTASPRPYPTRLPALEYPAQCEVRRVSRNGDIRWRNPWVNVSHVLGEEYIAFDEIDDGLWQVYFGPVVLGRFHERLFAIEDEHGRLARHHRTSGNKSRKVLPMSSD